MSAKGEGITKDALRKILHEVINGDEIDNKFKTAAQKVCEDVMERERIITEKVVQEVMQRTLDKMIDEKLRSLGCSVDEPLEMQADFAHLHKSRLREENRSRRVEFTIIGFVVTGILYILSKAFGVNLK